VSLPAEPERSSGRTNDPLNEPYTPRSRASHGQTPAACSCEVVTLTPTTGFLAEQRSAIRQATVALPASGLTAPMISNSGSDVPTSAEGPKTTPLV